ARPSGRPTRSAGSTTWERWRRRATTTRVRRASASRGRSSCSSEPERRRVMHRPTLTAVALLLAAAPAFARTSEEVEKKILDEVNAYRVKKGSPKLVVDDKLVAIAQAHAQGMAKADKLGDDGKNGHVWDGKNTTERLEAAGYKSALATENV